LGVSIPYAPHPARRGRIPDHAIRFRVPVDDTNTMTFWLRFYPYNEGDKGIEPFGMAQDKLREAIERLERLEL
jgi:hypothetical protein